MLRALIVFLAFVLCPYSAEARKVALVIGNNAYPNLATTEKPKKGQLEKAINDARAMRDLLQNDLKFDEVLYDENVSLATFKTLIFAFESEIAKDDIAVFYFAGHGAALNGLNYFIPSDVPKPGELEKNAAEDAIDAEQVKLAEFSIRETLVLQQISLNNPRLSLLVVDACRDNPLREPSPDNPFRDLRSGDVVFGGSLDTGEKQMAEGMMIVYSASFNERAMDSVPGKDALNSPFTTTLLKHLKKPGLGLKQVVAQTREEVFAIAKSANEKQTPAVYDQLFGGDIFLNGEPPEDLATISSVQQDWVRVKDTRSVTVLKAFREKHGDDPIAVALADEAIAALVVPSKVEDFDESTAQCDPISIATVNGREACLEPRAVFTDCDGCPEMVVLPPGRFVMGQLDDTSPTPPDEVPQHEVTVMQRFAVSKFEITSEQWAACARENGCQSNAFPADYGRGRGLRPVINVNWKDAQEYVLWLTKKTGQTYRLLTEAEWEYSARAGSSLPYASGWSIDKSHANFAEAQLGGTIEVGQYAANAFSLHDMHGNVWEWTADCYVYGYAGAPAEAQAQGGYNECSRVIRGGAWNSDKVDLRLSNRDYASKFRTRESNLGLRVAREISDTVAQEFFAARAVGGAADWESFIARHSGRLDFRVELARAELGRLEVETPEASPTVEVDCPRPFTLAVVGGEGRCLEPGTEFSDCDGCPTMLVMPTGKFTMGSPAGEKDRDENEGPQRSVTFSQGFAAAKMEVTRSQFAEFLQKSGHVQASGCNVLDLKPKSKNLFRLDANASFSQPGYAQATDQHPAVCVSWRDAKAYVSWLSYKAGSTYRLLSEAEWEYAARAETTTRYAFGGSPDDACDVENIADQTLKEKVFKDWTWKPGVLPDLFATCRDFASYTAPVGSYRKNTFGLHDMYGNVAEWVEDCYGGAHSDATTGDAIGGPEDCHRVMRGALVGVPMLKMFRAAFRTADSADARYNGVGFRVARTLRLENDVANAPP